MDKRLIEQELPLDQLIFTLLCMLLGDEGKDWAYYETDPDWWRLRLYMRIN